MDNACTYCQLLPPELWDTILFDLRDDPASLGAYALTSHTGCQLAKPHLFHNIVVSCTHKTRPIHAFVAFIRSSPYIARYVRNLKLRWRHPSERIPFVGSIDMNLLFPILEALSDLRRLSILIGLHIAKRFNMPEAPVANLDYLYVDWPNGFDPTSCTPVSFCNFLSLFGTIGELFIARLPNRKCTCIPLHTQEDGYGLWLTDESFRQMLSLPAHSLSQLGTTIGALKVKGLHGDFCPVLVPKMIQSMASLDALTSITIRCGHPKEVAAYGELLQICGRRLLHCRVEEGNTSVLNAYTGAIGQCPTLSISTTLARSSSSFTRRWPY